MKVQHIALLAATALLVGACGSGSSSLTGTNTQSGNGYTQPIARPAFRPLFQLAQGILPYPTDLLLQGSTDGTVKAPLLAVTPNVAALNVLDGFGVNTEMTVRFSKPVNPASLATPGAIVVIETTQRTVIASANSIARVPVGVRRVLVPGVDYSVGLSTAVDNDGTVISIKPLKPLTASSGGVAAGAPAGVVDDGGVGYVVLVTDAVTSTSGDIAGPDDEFALIESVIPAGSANPGSNCAAVGNATLAGVCQLTAPTLALAEAAGIKIPSIALAFSFTTESTRDTLVQMAGNILSGPAPALAAQVLHIPGTAIDLNDKDVLDPTNSNPALLGVANLYEGTLTLPYYQATPADATAAMPAPPLTARWQAASAVALVPGKTGSTEITRYNPIPAARHAAVPVPVLVTLPNNTTKPANGWPVVIFVHGITGNRSNMLAISEAYAELGYATVAIDLPLHGITPTDPAAALRIPGVAERTFDMDYTNNTTGLPGPDGKVDGSGANFIQIASPATSRDNLREAVLDELMLARALASPATVLVTDAGPVVAPFDPTKIQLAGQSLGGIVGATVASLPSNIQSFALSVPGGLITDLLLQSATFGPPIGGAVAAQLGANTFLYNRFFNDAQAAADAGDPINHIIAAAANKPLLVHKVVNDQVVPNSATDRLVALAGLPKLNAPGVFGYTAGQPGIGYVTFTDGTHGSLLDETANQYVTAEMQAEFATFAFLSGTAVEVCAETKFPTTCLIQSP